jgi:hypothetical protein
LPSGQVATIDRSRKIGIQVCDAIANVGDPLLTIRFAGIGENVADDGRDVGSLSANQGEKG